MAFKRENFKSLVSTKKEYFASSYGFKGKTNFTFGSDVYIIPLLDSGFYEIPCHRVITHKVDGKEIGFNGASFPIYIKCQGVSEDGNNQEALCCTLSKMEKERIPEKNDSGKRIISNRTWRVFFPILILGSSLPEDVKSYPVSKVALSKDFSSETGLKLSYLEMSNSTFRSELVTAYGNSLRDKGILDYDLDPNSEDFFEEVRKRLSRTVVKIHGGTKTGFNAPIKEYTFFPFEDPAIASQSFQGERDFIVNYTSNDAIMLKISEFLTLLDTQVDTLIRDWSEKDLQEYYNSARGRELSAPIQEEAKEETVEILPEAVNEPIQQEVQVAVQEAPKTVQQVVTPQPQPALVGAASAPVTQEQQYGKVSAAASDNEIADMLNNPVGSQSQAISDAELDEYSYDMEEDGDFFA